jgi:hypothetical protein
LGIPWWRYHLARQHAHGKVIAPRRLTTLVPFAKVKGHI